MQRIQTLYLLASTILMSIFCFSTLSTFVSSEGIYNLSVFGINSFNGDVVYNMPYLAVLALLASALPFVTIFLFKKRMLQIRMCVVEIVLTLGVLIVGGIYFYLANRFFGSTLGDATPSVRVVCIFPLIAIVFDYLAFKATFKDELLIKSLNRIR